MQPVVEILGHDSHADPGLIDGATPAGDVVHLRPDFQLCEDRLLSPAPLVQRHELAHRLRTIDQDEFDTSSRVIIGEREVQLQLPIGLLRLAGSNADRASRLIPAVRVPIALRIAHFATSAVPDVTPLDLHLQLSQVRACHRKRVLDAERIQRANDLITEECAVQSALDDYAGQDLADFPDVGENEGADSPGRVDLVGTMPYIKCLAGLRHSAQLQVVASLVNRPGEVHRENLAEPYVTLLHHLAPIARAETMPKATQWIISRSAWRRIF